MQYIKAIIVSLITGTIGVVLGAVATFVIGIVIIVPLTLILWSRKDHGNSVIESLKWILEFGGGAIGAFLGFASVLGSHSVERKRRLALRAEATTLQDSYEKTVNQIQRTLKRAAANFEERAFSPFWDNVEQANSLIAVLSGNIKRISQILEEQKSWKTADSPEPIEFRQPPDCAPLLKELRSLIEKAQKDYEFEQINLARKRNRIASSHAASSRDAYESLASSLSEIEEQLDDMKSRFDERA